MAGMKAVIKSWIKAVCRVRTLNLVLIPAARLCSPIIPKTVLWRIPYVGQVRLRLPHSRELILETDGNDAIASRIFWGGIRGFEPASVRLFLDLLEHSETIFDIGANTGIYALIAGAVNPRNKVYGFEPVARICDYFRRNVDVNHLENVEVHPLALTNKEGEIELYVPSEKVPHSASMLKGFIPDTEAVLVKTATIDSFVANHDIAKVDLLKVDTEATEHLVLEGGMKTIKRDRPAIICEVLAGRTESELHAVMDGLGYRYYRISREGLIESERICGNPTGDKARRDYDYLFVPEEKSREILPHGHGCAV